MKKKYLLLLILPSVILLAGCDDPDLQNNSDSTKDFNNSKSEKEQIKEIIKDEPKWNIKEDLIYTIPDDHKLGTEGTVGSYQEPVIYFSANGKEFAYKGKDKENNWVSNINGKMGGWITGIEKTFEGPAITGNHIKVTPTKVSGIYQFIYKGKNFGEIGEVPSSAAVSSDEKQYAYVITSTDNWKRNVVMNGEKGPSYKIIGMQSCSPDSHSGPCESPFAFAYDGKQNAYIAQKGQNSNVIIVNGKERQTHREIYFPAFSFDSKHFAYKALDGKAFVAIDGKEQKKYDGVYNMKFNKDGTLTYNALLDNKILFVIQDLKE